MGRTYEFSVMNRSGEKQNYVFYAEPANVQPNTNPLPVVIKTTRTSPNAMAQLEVSPEYYVIAGISHGSLGRGVEITLIDNKSVNRDVEFTLQDGTPELARASGPGSQGRGSFTITTANNFTHEEASNQNVVLGIAMTLDMGMNQTPLSVWVPDPGQTYIVQQPLKIKVIASNEYREGQVVQPDMIKSANATADFEMQRDVTVVHEVNGEMTTSIS